MGDVAHVAALYVESGGVYFDLPGVDPWDEARDALRYAGPWPVVAHPPCNRWSIIAPSIERRFGHKVGDDGGCFAAALDAVRTYGGVLEHPAHSRAWRHFGLPLPLRAGGWTTSLDDPGWSCWVDQGWYGHPYKKPTWLYACGLHDPPPLAWGPGPGAVRPHRGCTLSEQSRKRVMMPTPPPFRDLLLDLARAAR
jgi:hypothetical protein